jgi:hypothetical protein
LPDRSNLKDAPSVLQKIYQKFTRHENLRAHNRTSFQAMQR